MTQFSFFRLFLFVFVDSVGEGSGSGLMGFGIDMPDGALVKFVRAGVIGVVIEIWVNCIAQCLSMIRN